MVVKASKGPGHGDVQEPLRVAKRIRCRHRSKSLMLVRSRSTWAIHCKTQNLPKLASDTPI